MEDESLSRYSRCLSRAVVDNNITLASWAHLISLSTCPTCDSFLSSLLTSHHNPN